MIAAYFVVVVIGSSVDLKKMKFTVLITRATSIRVSMLPMEIPAISFLAVRLVNLALRSAMDPRSLRSG